MAGMTVQMVRRPLSLTRVSRFHRTDQRILFRPFTQKGGHRVILWAGRRAKARLKIDFV